MVIINKVDTTFFITKVTTTLVIITLGTIAMAFIKITIIKDNLDKIVIIYN